MERSALVTGASGGIGRAIAIDMAKAGYNIGVHYRSNEISAKEISKEIESYGVKAILLKADLSDSEQCKDIVDQCSQLGQLYVLVNNAGITRDGLIMAMKDENFKNVIDANLTSCFNMTKFVLPIMLKKKAGRIINISSVIGVTGNAGQANYAASKAGMIGFSKSCAKEVAKRGICVNVVAPGYIQTPMTDVLSDNIKKDITAKIPLKRLGSPSDVAGVVSFLASDSASYITGQVLCVDGGMVI